MSFGKIKRELLWYFCMFLMIASFAVILMGAYQYYSAYHEWEKNALRNGDNTLHLLESLHSSVMDQVDICVQTIQTDSQFATYMDSHKNKEYIRCRNIIERLSSLVSSSAYLKSIYVYFPDEHYTVSSDFGPSELEWFYDTEFISTLETTKWDYATAFRRTIRNPFAASIATGEVVTLVRTLPAYAPHHTYRALIVVNIDNASISSALKEINISNSELLVLDRNGDFITGTSDLSYLASDLFALTSSETDERFETVKLDEREMVVQHAVSDRGWIYYYIQPASEMMGELSVIRTEVYAACTIILLLSIVLSLLLSRRAFLPLQMISDKISTEFIEADTSYSKETEHILDKIDLLIEKNRQFEKEREAVKLDDEAALSNQYPAEYENRLLLAIKSRNSLCVRKELDQLMIHMFRTNMRHMSIVQAYQRLYDVIQSVYSDEDMRSELTEIATDSQSELDFALEKLCNRIIASIQPKKDKAVSSLVTDTKNYVDDHLSEDLRIENIADKYYVSASHLRRVFKAEMSMTLKEYIDSRRIVKAKTLLMDKDMQIQKIAQQIGYPHAQSFITFFHTNVGMSPGEYRAQTIAAEEQGGEKGYGIR